MGTRREKPIGSGSNFVESVGGEQKISRPESGVTSELLRQLFHSSRKRPSRRKISVNTGWSLSMIRSHKKDTGRIERFPIKNEPTNTMESAIDIHWELMMYQKIQRGPLVCVVKTMVTVVG